MKKKSLMMERTYEKESSEEGRKVIENDHSGKL